MEDTYIYIYICIWKMHMYMQKKIRKLEVGYYKPSHQSQVFPV